MDKQIRRFAKSIALACVRHTSIEDLHSGSGARSKTGDYSDVKVVTPYREIPWDELSRISQEEMKELMKEVVNKIYTVLVNIENPEFIAALNDLGDKYTSEWDEPEFLPDFVLKEKRAEEIGK
jgi:hypothetical protein